jgi:hypothetical protein
LRDIRTSGPQIPRVKSARDSGVSRQPKCRPAAQAPARSYPRNSRPAHNRSPVFAYGTIRMTSRFGGRRFSIESEVSTPESLLRSSPV